MVPRPYLRVHGDVAAVLADDGVGGGQTQPGALLFGGEIRVKDFLQIFRSYASPLSVTLTATDFPGGRAKAVASVISTFSART